MMLQCHQVMMRSSRCAPGIQRAIVLLSHPITLVFQLPSPVDFFGSIGSQLLVQNGLCRSSKTVKRSDFVDNIRLYLFLACGNFATFSSHPCRWAYHS